eukprot:SM000064S19737  [mRNA]  locus=s64:131230:133609:- [translate_table: standard]
MDAPVPKEAAANNPGLCETPDETTKGYIFQQTMYRIKDPKASLDFYSRVLGMTLLKRLDYPSGKFSIYFMGYELPMVWSENLKRAKYDLFNDVSRISGRILMKYLRKTVNGNWGTESDPDCQHHNGNKDPRGYGHIGLVVDDVRKACERFEQLGIQFVKRPDEGQMKGLAFIQDPDGYWIEILDNKTAFIAVTANNIKQTSYSSRVYMEKAMSRTVQAVWIAGGDLVHFARTSASKDAFIAKKLPATHRLGEMPDESMKATICNNSISPRRCT